MKPIPFLGGGTAGKSYSVTRQRKLNIYLEHRPDGDKGVKVVAFGTPGMRTAFTISPALTSPIRALQGTPTQLYVVSGNKFIQLSSTGTQIFTANITTSAGYASIAYSATQLVMVDGTNGYLVVAGVLSTIGASFPNGAKTVIFVAGFFVAEQPGSQKFWVSNLFDGSTWGGLAFASASQSSDNILAVDNLGGILVIFCQLHMEFWQNVGSTPQPFAPILSASNSWGLGAIFSRVMVAESICFLGVTRGGQFQICRLQGYVVTVISTSDVEAIINSFSNVSDAVGMSYQIDTHAFYQITFPTADRSFLYDCSTGIWSETQTGHTTNYATRHLGNLSTLFANQVLVSDATSGNIYLMDPAVYTDNTVTIERELITRFALDGYNEFTVDEIYLDMEVGVGLNTGQGSNPMVMLQISRDAGKTWETEQWVPMGLMGEYLTRVLWRRQGSVRQMLVKVRYTDPTKFVIANGALSVREAPQ